MDKTRLTEKQYELNKRKSLFKKQNESKKK